ncbi:MAG: hypothetical protein FJW36_00580 [Acidobacteria bacterium]|nr:hypothetical protein [Acidobacteriota bacterium]
MALEMKFGGDRKQFMTLGILGVVLLVILYMNYFSGPSYEERPTPRPQAAPAANAPLPAIKKTDDRKRQVDRRAQEFRPRIGPARPEDRLDPMTVDPTLRLELLAKLEKVQITGGTRSLFDFSNLPTVAANTNVPKIIPSPKKGPTAPKPFIGPMNEPPPPPKPVVTKPNAPPIPLKFYGFTSAPRGGNKKGFFLDGEDIVVAGEGDLIKKRYKVIRIGLANVTMEDTQFEQQQMLPIVPDNGGGGF